MRAVSTTCSATAAAPRSPTSGVLDALSRTFFLTLAGNGLLRRLASSYGMRENGFARRFISGETLDAALATAARLRDRGFLSTLNYLGESVSSTAEAAAAADVYADMLRQARDAGLDSQISVKLTQLGLATDPVGCEDNLRRVLDAAGERCFVRVDMEQATWVDPTLDLVERAWSGGHRNVGVVLQSYLYRTPDDLTRLNRLGIGVRLCKGAYQEPRETAYPVKADVNAAFLALARTLLADAAYPAFATHDPNMIAATRAQATELGRAPDSFEFQMLFGVRRDLQASLRDDGYRVRVYLPYGSQWFPYFMRRLGERPANVLFVLRSLFFEHGAAPQTPRGG